MSYDVYVEMDAGGPEPMFVDLGNMTSNVSGIWKKAMYGTGVADFDGKEARECVNVLEEGIEQMKLYPERFRDMEPSNGWGSVDGAREYLERLRDGFLRYPRATVRVSR